MDQTSPIFDDLFINALRTHRCTGFAAPEARHSSTRPRSTASSSRAAGGSSFSSFTRDGRSFKFSSTFNGYPFNSGTFGGGTFGGDPFGTFGGGTFGGDPFGTFNSYPFNSKPFNSKPFNSDRSQTHSSSFTGRDDYFALLHTVNVFYSADVRAEVHQAYKAKYGHSFGTQRGSAANENMKSIIQERIIYHASGKKITDVTDIPDFEQHAEFKKVLESIRVSVMKLGDVEWHSVITSMVYDNILPSIRDSERFVSNDYFSLFHTLNVFYSADIRSEALQDYQSKYGHSFGTQKDSAATENMNAIIQERIIYHASGKRITDVTDIPDLEKHAEFRKILQSIRDSVWKLESSEIPNSLSRIAHEILTPTYDSIDRLFAERLDEYFHSFHEANVFYKANIRGEVYEECQREFGSTNIHNLYPVDINPILMQRIIYHASGKTTTTIHDLPNLEDFSRAKSILASIQSSVDRLIDQQADPRLVCIVLGDVHPEISRVENILNSRVSKDDYFDLLHTINVFYSADVRSEVNQAYDAQSHNPRYVSKSQYEAIIMKRIIYYASNKTSERVTGITSLPQETQKRIAKSMRNSLNHLMGQGNHKLNSMIKSEILPKMAQVLPREESSGECCVQ
jgi:hypothetical protein